MSAADELRAMLKIVIIAGSTRPGCDGAAVGESDADPYGPDDALLGAR
jgi:hypothetical protein